VGCCRPGGKAVGAGRGSPGASTHSDGLIDEAETLQRVTTAHVETYCSQSCRRTRLAAKKAFSQRACRQAPASHQGGPITEVDAGLDAATGAKMVHPGANHPSPDGIHGMMIAAGSVTETVGHSPRADGKP